MTLPTSKLSRTEKKWEKVVVVEPPRRHAIRPVLASEYPHDIYVSANGLVLFGLNHKKGQAPPE